MTISFFEPGDVPQPPEKTKIEHIAVQPSDDGWRVKVEIHVTPFQQRPSIEMSLIKLSDNGEGNTAQVSQFSIIETMHPKMEFTMHLRGISAPEGDYQLHTTMYYRDTPAQDATTLEPPQVQDERVHTFKIENPAGDTE